MIRALPRLPLLSALCHSSRYILKVRLQGYPESCSHCLSSRRIESKWVDSNATSFSILVRLCLHFSRIFYLTFSISASSAAWVIGSNLRRSSIQSIIGWKAALTSMIWAFKSARAASILLTSFNNRLELAPRISDRVERIWKVTWWVSVWLFLGRGGAAVYIQYKLPL